MPESDLALLRQAAAQAGDIALRHFRADPKVWDKGGSAGPVTEADYEVNEMLQDTLCRARPDYGWLSEETPDGAARLGTRRQFVVDPIDGTRAFIEGSKGWGHSIAVVEDGQPVAAVVVMPVREETYWAEARGGAFKDGRVLSVAPDRALTEAEVLTAKPNLKPDYWHVGAPPAFRRAFRSSLAYRMAAVAEGRFDAMLTLRATWEWDIAAGALLLSEAGGQATDRKGRALRFNSPEAQVDGVVAGGPAAAKLLAALA